MFTGIIEAVGTITAINKNSQGAQVKIATSTLDMSDVKLGDSIAANGVCLTVVDFGSDYYCADISNETLKLTGFIFYSVGQRVNLEKAMLATTRFGGHMVSGHVDAVCQVAKISNNGHSTDYWIAMSDDIAHYIAQKGSVTIDGVSLTVNGLTPTQFRLTIVPHTAQETIISQYTVGAKVNVEVDVVARYLERLLTKTHTPQTSSNETASEGVTQSLLMKSGFMSKGM